MPKPKSAKSAQAAVVNFFARQRRGVFRQSDLAAAFREHADEWGLPGVRSTVSFIAFLLDSTPMHRVTLESEHYRGVTRYVWDKARPYELAASLGKNAYLSHASAVFLHGLTDQAPKVVYVNDEQSPKTLPAPVLSQQGIDKAFAGNQRTSRASFTVDGLRAVLISGKHTGRLEVAAMTAPDGSVVDVTKIERTLIDIAVRPEYAGGPYQVRDAYAGARERVSVNVLVATLRKLDYAYPYHQVIGLYMERAGFDASRLEPLRRLGLRFSFYLTYGMRDTIFDAGWKLHTPRGF